MLSYRHGFHAGNHADVLKHVALRACLVRLTAKAVPVLYVDTHAGAGVYSLREGFSAQNREWAGGVERLRSCAKDGPLPEPLRSYIELVGAYGDSYPGSPAVAAATLRGQDRLALFELHPNDYRPLSALFAGDSRVDVRNSDGFSGLKGLLPPPSRRGLVLIDPSYELAADYGRTVDAVAGALRRFATGLYLVWYPLLERNEARLLPDQLMGLADKALHCILRVRSSLPDQRGMSGSGLVLINPPWMVRESMAEVLPCLAHCLAEDEGAAWRLEAKGLD